MRYYSTNRKTDLVDFKEATIQGQAPDGGLFFPGSIPALSNEFLASLGKSNKADIAFTVIRPYVGDTIPEDELHLICKHTCDFSFPLVKVSDDIYSLELFHGPTLAFKDVGARFMSQCLGYFSKGIDREVTVLVATSGDTGSAVANGFLGVEGVKVVILYPSKKVSHIQELQLTTLGKNISAIEVEGTFDDCQRMVKSAFADSDLRQKLFLTSANSINIARWLPQQFYYFFALSQWQEESLPVVSVPSGNFGNICAGLLAKKSGLPIKHFIAACNTNDVVTRYLKTGDFNKMTTIPTLSNAMDVGNPSNLVRILELYEHDLQKLKTELSSESISDRETIDTIKTVFQLGYTLDPHGAVGYTALKRYLEKNQNKGIFLETAHPIKFDEIVEKATGSEVTYPDSVSELLTKRKESVSMKPVVSDLKEYLIN